MDSLFNNNLSLQIILLIFYLSTISGFSTNLMSPKVLNELKNNRFMQHCVSFITIFVLVSLFIINKQKTLIVSVLIYIWFLMVIKLNTQFQIIIILLIFLSLFVNFDDFYYSNKYKDKNKNLDKSKTLYILTIVLFAITIFGNCLYLNKKYNQYGGDFNFFKFCF